MFLIVGLCYGCYAFLLQYENFCIDVGAADPNPGRVEKIAR